MSSKTFSKFPLWLWLLIGFNSMLFLGFLTLIAFCSNKFKNDAHFDNPTEGHAISRVGSLNRAQKVYFREHNKFAPGIDLLGDYGKTDTSPYRYSTYIDSSRKTISNFNYPHIAIQIAQSQTPELRSYVGAIWLSQVGTSGYVTYETILCEANNPGTSIPPVPIIKSEGVMECALGTQW